MNERPIIFSGAMVRALLDGTKTQTRRALKVCCQEIGERDDGSRWPWSENPDTTDDYWHPCPYGQPGDRLWVRETWYCDHWDVQQGPYREVEGARELLVYRVDGERPYEAEQPVWRPSIHMPRWASRIQLEITGVRVERLNDISTADAKAEGIKPDKVRQIELFGANAQERAAIYRDAAVRPYQKLWESINGASSWDANPWVWVVEFKRVQPNDYRAAKAASHDMKGPQ